MSDAAVISTGERAEILARCEELYNDLGYKEVRAWKERNPGKKAVGWLPVWAPRELIHAAGMLPVGVMGAGDRLEIVKGDAYYQSYICHFPRSVIELGLNGALDVLDGVLFPSTCDVIRNLSGMWQILFPTKFVRYVDVPQNFDTEIGGHFFAEDLRRLGRELAELGGVEVTPEALRRSIAIHDENRAAVQRLYSLRVQSPWLLPSHELYLVLRAGCVLPVEEHTALLRRFAELTEAVPSAPRDMARIAVRGCFCEQPPLDLIRTLERSGCWIVDDDWLLCLRWFSAPVARAGDPHLALAEAFILNSPACPTVYLSAGRKGDALLNSVRECGAEGVIFMAASFCDPALLDQPMTQGAVEKAGVPCSALLYSENTGQFQVIREQAGTFADAIKLA